MSKYDPKKIEKKWQKYWEENKTFEVTEDKVKEKFYSLIEFPYPSGDGLHVGHPRPFTAMDVISRKKRMEGKNVLFPIGFDSFGLPTENFAIKTGKPPAEVTKKNIANFTRQLKMLGYSFDWSRVVDTSDPKYYKWTQWLFLQFFKHGLAYKKNQPINWCPKDKIGLANEEVVNGCCERCGTAVEKRNKEQWMLAITKYADKLLNGLKNVDYIERAQVQQQNWIGKSEGAEIKFSVLGSQFADQLTVFTTRPDTIFGVTFLAISTDVAKKWLEAGWAGSAEIKKYIENTDVARAANTTREEVAKTGIDTGVKVINPVNKQQVPVWITNYVISDFGTGAVMGVPAHDERDWDFAQKYGLAVAEVVQSKDVKTKYLIFDFDGVIGDTYEASIDVRLKMGDVKNREEAVESIFNYFNRKPNHTKNHDLTEGQLQETLRWIQKYGEEMVKINYPLFSDFNKEIQKIPNTKIAIISAGSGLYIRNRIAETGLNPTHVLTFEDHHSKEEKLEQVCKDWGVKMQDIYYFTDSKADVYELENCMDRKKLIGCAWGYCGYDALRELLPAEQILKESSDIKKIFKEKIVTEDGVAVNSDFLNGLETSAAKEKIISWVEENKVGKKQINFKLRDWVFSRQRYWGEPIPLVHCENCDGWIPLPENELPLQLPKVEKYQPTDNGESPLAAMTEWVNTKCPQCGGPAKRETDTMPNWAGSSWYSLRYADPHNDQEFAAMDKLKYWTPVDWYNGGMEHVVLHLLYSRFWNIFLHDIGLVPVSEPYAKRTAHGMILAKGGEKMSKSKGNVINPDDMVEQFGADALRTYIMFMGPFDQAVEWDTNGLVGVKRFLDKVWNLQEKVVDSKSVILNKVKDLSLSKNNKLTAQLHQTIQKVGDDIEAMRFNTAISSLMELVNELTKEEKIDEFTYQTLIKLLSPFAPHMAEELWSNLDDKESLVFESWPKADPSLMVDQEFTLAVQINGKLRDTITVPAEISEDEAKKMSLASEKVKKWLEGKEPKKVIYVKGKLISIVI